MVTWRYGQLISNNMTMQYCRYSSIFSKSSQLGSTSHAVCPWHLDRQRRWSLASPRSWCYGWKLKRALHHCVWLGLYKSRFDIFPSSLYYIYNRWFCLLFYSPTSCIWFTIQSNYIKINILEQYSTHYGISQTPWAFYMLKFEQTRALQTLKGCFSRSCMFLKVVAWF